MQDTLVDQLTKKDTEIGDWLNNANRHKKSGKKADGAPVSKNVH